MQKKSLPMAAIKVFRIWITILMSILSFFCGMIAVFNLNTAIFAILIFIILYLYIIFFYCKQRYNNEHYCILNKKLYREKGVFFKKETEIYSKNIQGIKIITGPIQNFFGLYTVIIYTAGFNEKIALIELQEAKTIKESLQVAENEEI